MPRPIKQVITESLLLAEALAARQREILRRIRRNERRQRGVLMESLEGQPPRVVRHGAVTD